jgi:hypothetical protein
MLANRPDEASSFKDGIIPWTPFSGRVKSSILPDLIDGVVVGGSGLGEAWRGGNQGQGEAATVSGTIHFSGSVGRAAF